MDYTITLTKEEDAVLRDQVARSEDRALTPEALLLAIVQAALQPKVGVFRKQQTVDVIAKLDAMEADARQTLIDTILAAKS